MHNVTRRHCINNHSTEAMTKTRNQSSEGEWFACNIEPSLKADLADLINIIYPMLEIIYPCVQLRVIPFALSKPL